jgi:tetratricopeptide (TPR) repeat protein
VVAIEHMVSGLLERALGDYDSAMNSLESALNINLKEHRHNRVTSCMIKLAETEVMSFEPTSVNQNQDTSGKWMTKLRKYGDEMDLLGVKGLAFYLKGELRLKQGRHDEAQEFAEKVLKMSEVPGLTYLKEKARLIQEVTTPGKKK